MEEKKERSLEKLLSEFLYSARKEESEFGNLSIVNDMETLISYLESVAPIKSEAGELIETKIKEILPEILPTIDDMKKLISWWRNTSFESEPRKMIEARMKEILPTINDKKKLISYWRSASPGSELKRLIETKIKEILPEILPTIDDMKKLISWRRSSFPGSEPRKMIEARMREILKDISSEIIPNWFYEMLKNPKNIPVCLREEFRIKAKILFGSIS